ncbi:MAG TPA: glycosyltransferase family 39 protein [Syntrophorhabdaceae bacterium]|nr:glycosyltransferase family 39 protein [Syntrophorhabdaceae bacterium]
MTKDRQIKQILALLILSYAVLFYGIGDYSLKEPDEGRYAEIPREMNELHDYIVPHLNYVRYFEKPPLLYWVDALSFKVLRTNEWSFRFPNALSALLCVLFLFIFARRWLGRESAFLSSIILITCFGFFAMARIVTIDMLFTLCLFLALLSFHEFYRERKPFFIYLFYAVLGAATLAKGPVALILLGATILIFLVTEHNLHFVPEMRLIRGLAIYLVITLPWIVAISFREKEFLYFFFVDQHFLRFLTSRHNRSGPIYYFLPVLFGGMFPWSIFIPRAMAHLFRDKSLRLMVIWAAVVFVFFSISGSKLPPYILPVFPPLAMVLGHFFQEKWGSLANRWAEGLVYAFIFLIFALAAALLSFSPLSAYVKNMSTDAPLIMKNLALFSIWISLCSFIAGFLFLSGGLTRYSRIVILLSFFSFAVVCGILLNLGVVDRLNTAKNLAVMINQEKAKADYVIDYSSYDQTLPFYMRRGITIASYTGELEMGAKYEDAKDIFISDAAFLDLVSSEKNVLFVTKQKRIKTLEEHFPGRIHVRACENDRCLVANY